LAQLGQFGQRGVRAATTIKQAVDFLHEFSQRSQLRLAARDVLQRSSFPRRQVVLDK
jgi:hypothetical protein